MRPGVDVGAGDRLGQGDRSGLGADHARRVEVRRGGRGGGELGRELPEGGVGAAPLDQAEGGQVPEQGRAAVAQHHLVPVGQPEQLGQPGPDRADQVLDRGLAVRGAEQRGAGGRQRVHRIRSDLGRPAAEAAVAGKQVTRGWSAWSRRTIVPRLPACTISRPNGSTTPRGHLLEADVPGDAGAAVRGLAGRRHRGPRPGPAGRAERHGGGHQRGGPAARPDGAAEERVGRRASSSSPTTARTRAPRSRPTRRSRCTSAGTRCSGRCGWRGRPSGRAGPSRRTTSAPDRAARSSAPGPRPSPARWPRRRSCGRVRGGGAAVRRAGRAVPGVLGRLPGDARVGGVLAGPAQPDARPAALHPRRSRLDPHPPRSLRLQPRLGKLGPRLRRRSSPGASRAPGGSGRIG